MKKIIDDVYNFYFNNIKIFKSLNLQNIISIINKIEKCKNENSSISFDYDNDSIYINYKYRNNLIFKIKFDTLNNIYFIHNDDVCEIYNLNEIDTCLNKFILFNA